MGKICQLSKSGCWKTAQGSSRLWQLLHSSWGCSFRSSHSNYKLWLCFPLEHTPEIHTLGNSIWGPIDSHLLPTLGSPGDAGPQAASCSEWILLPHWRENERFLWCLKSLLAAGWKGLGGARKHRTDSSWFCLLSERETACLEISAPDYGGSQICVQISALLSLAGQTSLNHFKGSCPHV